MNRYNISTHSRNVNALDFDQNRKELVVGCLGGPKIGQGGRIQSYSIRYVAESRGGKAHFIGVFRLQNRLSDEAGKVFIKTEFYIGDQ